MISVKVLRSSLEDETVLHSGFMISQQSSKALVEPLGQYKSTEGIEGQGFRI